LNKAIKSGHQDNVATLISDAKKDSKIKIFYRDQLIEIIKSKKLIPFGHKIATDDIKVNTRILKYNESIGLAKKNISKGDLVHTSEVQSKFDLKKNYSKEKKYKIKINEFKRKLKIVLKTFIKNKRIVRVLENYFFEAQLKNIHTHGIKRLPLIIKRIQNNSININPKIKKKWEGSKLIVDANNTFGHYAMMLAIQEIKKKINQKKTISCLIKNSTHFGYAGYYSSKIANLNCVSFVTSNGPALMAPIGYKEPVVSNNPLSISAKIHKNKFFEFDSATSNSSRAKIHNDISLSGKIKKNLMINNQGYPTENIEDLNKSFLMPMQNHKGFGLALSLEILTGVLSNGPILKEIKHKDKSFKKRESLSHFIFAVKGNYQKKIKNLIKQVDNAKTQSKVKSNWPGQNRHINLMKNLKKNFFEIDQIENDILNNKL